MNPYKYPNLVDNSLLNEIENNFGNNGAQAFQAPIVGGEQSQPLQEISSVGSQQGSQPALARAAETYNPSGYVDSSYNSAGYGNSYSYGSSQGSGYSAVNTQGSGSSSGYFPDCPSLFCFSADTTIKLSNGQTKRIDELNINDWVLSANTSQVNILSCIYNIFRLASPVSIIGFTRCQKSRPNSFELNSLTEISLKSLLNIISTKQSAVTKMNSFHSIKSIISQSLLRT